nr:hypothetical protein [Pandoravirus massiliensis]
MSVPHCFACFGKTHESADTRRATPLSCPRFSSRQKNDRGQSVFRRLYGLWLYFVSFVSFGNCIRSTAMDACLVQCLEERSHDNSEAIASRAKDAFLQQKIRGKGVIAHLRSWRQAW